MKRIIKQEPPESVRRWSEINRSRNNDWDRNRMSKKDLKLHLLKEQGGLCCYCERDISQENDSNKESKHIEHLKPQSKYPELVFDLTNLLLSCSGDEDENNQKCTHCGHAKGDEYDESKFISPLASDCETKFQYLKDGQIISADPNPESAANFTIELLKLNSPVLRKQRESVISVFDELKENSETPEFLLSEEEQKSLAEEYLKQQDGFFKPFWTTIKYLYVND